MSVDLGLPPEAWPDHPHWPTQVLLLGSHRNFRHISSTLVERAEQDAEGDAILTVFRWWKSAMRGHEHYEEHKLYPYLAYRFSAFGLSTAAMEEGHDALRDADRAVHRADTRAALTEALVRHDAVLRTHLDYEESVVIPALLALEPEDFEAYTQHDLLWLLENHRPVVRDGGVGSAARGLTHS